MIDVTHDVTARRPIILSKANLQFVKLNIVMSEEPQTRKSEVGPPVLEFAF